MISNSYRNIPMMLAALAMAFVMALALVGTAHAQTATDTTNIPSGYTQYDTNGNYYNSSTGLYYDANTGQYSSSAPTDNSGSSGTSSSTGTTTNPGVPNTGAGGTAGETVAILGATAAIAIGAAALVLRKESKA